MLTEVSASPREETARLAAARSERTAQAPCVATMRLVAALAAGPSHASDSSSIDVVARSRTMLAERNRKLRERVQAVRSGRREVVLLSLHGGVTAEPVAPTRRSPRTGPRARYADLRQSGRRRRANRTVDSRR